MANLPYSIRNCISRSYGDDYTRYCLEISRVIASSIAKCEVPSRCELLPLFIREACGIETNNHQLAALVVVVFFANRARQIGWFSSAYSAELIYLTNKIANKFETNLNTGPSQTSLIIISTIMPRFYPRLKMYHVFGFLEVQPVELKHHNYGCVFQIPNDLKFSPGYKICLFVVRADNIETSSCLVTPPRVDFFMNGIQVVRQNSSFLDSGPQLPINIKSLLRYGSNDPNLLQASGFFEGNYIVAVALVSELPKPDSASLQDYEHAPATVDSDCEIIGGASGISLNCPISFRRINIPVKGLSCNHISCFDFDNYVKINSRKPHWRCPSCNKPTSFTDIRLDQNMLKVLKEVDPNVSTISFSVWATVIGTTEAHKDLTSNTERDEPQQFADVVDLTQDDDDMTDAVPTHQTDQARVYEASGSVQPTSDHGFLRWVPGQMQGSLPGQFYNNYYHQSIALSMQQAEAARSMLGVTSPLANVRPQFMPGRAVYRNPPPNAANFGGPWAYFPPSGMQ